MKRLAILIGIAITSVAAAVGNLVIARMTGFNIFSLKLWFIFPAGALIVGVAASSGGLLAARLFNAAPKIIDAVFMAMLAAMTMFLIYYLDYFTAVLDDGRRVSSIATFAQYVDFELTTAHMRVGRGARDVGEVGQFGYWLAISEFVGFFLGGLCVFFILLAMERCRTCKAYLRKLKSKKSKETVLLDFQRGELASCVRSASLETSKSYAKREGR
jgi:hypothetical protein